MILQITEERLTGLYFWRVSDFLFKNIDYIWLIFQSLGSILVPMDWKDHRVFP